MLFSTHPRKLLSEAAAADLLDPKVSDEVKEVIDDMEDILTNNIEEVKDADKTTNGGVPVVAEAVAVLESAAGYGEKAKYLVTLESVIAVMENEGEKLAAEAEDVAPGEAPTPEAVEANEPHAGNVIEDIAARNGVEADQVAVVISTENFRFLAEMAILEAKCGKAPEDCEAAKKLGKARKVAKELQAADVKLVKGAPKKAKKAAKGKK